MGILQISPRYEDGTKNDAKTVKNDNFVNDRQKKKSTHCECFNYRR